MGCLFGCVSLGLGFVDFRLFCTQGGLWEVLCVAGLVGLVVLLFAFDLLVGCFVVLLLCLLCLLTYFGCLDFASCGLGLWVCVLIVVVFGLL